MLSQMYIENIAVIDRATVDFTEGFNVFTGETGAGKSIVIDAIHAILGERFSRDLIRNGESKASVTACFTALSPTVKEALEDMGYDPEDELVIYRCVNEDGKNICKINGRPATVSILRDLSDRLVDIHGQHDNQALLSQQRHIEYIDAYAENEALLLQYKAEYAAYRKLQKRLEELSDDDTERQRRVELLRFQTREIEEVQLTVGEEAELTERRRLIKNSEALVESLNEAYQALVGGDEFEGAVSLVESVADRVSESSEIMKELSPMAARLEEMKYELKEFSDELYSTAESVEFDPGELEEIEERLDVLFKLKKKYGKDEQEILAFYDRAAAELEELSAGETDRTQLEEEAEEKRAKVQKLADELSRRRVAAANNFVEKVGEEAAFLNMPHVKVTVKHTQTPLSPNGIDDMCLLVTTNAGEEPKPLVKIASGGELSRIMLAIKSVLARFDPVQTMIFDEIDTGVSGIAAEKIGKKLCEIATQRQVLCVTHLAQIACMADNHLLIEKSSRNGRTYTQVQPLDHEGRKHEIARIISGETITEAALLNAEQMLKQKDGKKDKK
ncbi:MAG TPA: DNA repair protein RecN [Ruminococcaceae bacterium]|nr:DNA repair protein RecN [Oscillospiraceae bacterium]